MRPVIPEEVLQDVRRKVDLKELISEYIILKKKGNGYVGLCPFHLEKTPSFTVSPDKQLFYCFGCGCGGDALTFLMKKENLDFYEAVTKLADRLGIPINQKEPTPEQRQRQRYFKINEMAADFFHYLLLKSPVGQPARDYLNSRGINEESIRKFHLGFAPNGWDKLFNFLSKRGFNSREISEVGLILPNKKGGFYDRFRSRLMFPIFDHRGQVIAFGGRALGDDQPKYLNSPDTPVFHKGKNLYGLNVAAPHIREVDEAVIVEGYLDVISAHQFGVQNVIASLGTAFTREQAQLLMRYTSRVTIAYDSDFAGRQATDRGLKILEDMGCLVRVLSLPEDKDPDEFLQKHGAAAFREVMSKESRSLIEYKLDKAKADLDVTDVQGKVKVIDRLAGDLLELENEVARSSYIKMIAHDLSLSEQAIYQELRKYHRQNLTQAGRQEDKKGFLRNNIKESYSQLPDLPMSGKKRALSPRQMAEKGLLQLIIKNPGVWTKVESELGRDFLENRILQEILQVYLESDETDRKNTTLMLARLKSEQARNLMARLLIEEDFLQDQHKGLEDYIKIIKQHRLQQRRMKAEAAYQQAVNEGDINLAQELLTEIQQLLMATKQS